MENNIKMWEGQSQVDLTTNSNLFQNSRRFIVSIGTLEIIPIRL